MKNEGLKIQNSGVQEIKGSIDKGPRAKSSIQRGTDLRTGK